MGSCSTKNKKCFKTAAVLDDQLKDTHSSSKDSAKNDLKMQWNLIRVNKAAHAPILTLNESILYSKRLVRLREVSKKIKIIGISSLCVV
ncbi:unnamed protein product [Blepharisma stoltei]|uniref:Uncharacterized protein n=1 Tax=Blepharisma stoltei TaxID=1481888 RepID=A0AAU9K8C9_9CILI|nr:unnamed protein product [Blepharisma stoltei]